MRITQVTVSLSIDTQLVFCCCCFFVFAVLLLFCVVVVVFFSGYYNISENIGNVEIMKYEIIS